MLKELWSLLQPDVYASCTARMTNFLPSLCLDIVSLSVLSTWAWACVYVDVSVCSSVFTCVCTCRLACGVVCVCVCV